MASADFPILNLEQIESNFEDVAKELYEASCKWGFYIVTGHGIENVDRMFELAKLFFDEPIDIKSEKMMGEDIFGYDGKKFSTFSASEGMVFGNTPGAALGEEPIHGWWDKTKRQEVEDFKAQCHDLSIKILSCYASCMGLDKDFFLPSHQHGPPGNTLKMIRYPRLDNQPDESIPRLSAHTDFGSITFVFTKQKGLEIRDPQNRWAQVPVVPGGIIVNIADALSLWTGKTLKSTLHRITWENVPRDTDRYSMAYFVQPNYNTSLQSIKDSGKAVGTSLTYKEYHGVRMRQTYASIEDSQTGEKTFKDVDPEMAQKVKSLGVAHAGVVLPNEIKA